MFTIFPAKILSLQTSRLVPKPPDMKVPNTDQLSEISGSLLQPPPPSPLPRL